MNFIIPMNNHYQIDNNLILIQMINPLIYNMRKFYVTMKNVMD